MGKRIWSKTQKQPHFLVAQILNLDKINGFNFKIGNIFLNAKECTEIWDAK